LPPPQTTTIRRAFGQRLAQQLKSGLAGPAHQGITGNAALFDSDAIQFSHLSGAVQFDGQFGHQNLLRNLELGHNTPVIFANPAASVTVAAADAQLAELAAAIKRWGRELGFQQVGIADIDLGTA
jgi:hypothetical protein